MKNTKSERIQADLALIAGLTKRLASSTGLEFSGQNHTVADLIATLNARIDATHAADAAKATWTAQLEAANAKIQSTAQLVADLREALLVKFKGQPDALADFGIAARKSAAKLTGEEMVEK